MSVDTNKKPIRVTTATYEALKAMAEAEAMSQAEMAERIFAAGLASLALRGTAALPASTTGGQMNAYTQELVNEWTDHQKDPALDFGSKLHKLVVCGIGRFDALKRDAAKNEVKKMAERAALAARTSSDAAAVAK